MASAKKPAISPHSLLHFVALVISVHKITREKECKYDVIGGPLRYSSHRVIVAAPPSEPSSIRVALNFQSQKEKRKKRMTMIITRPVVVFALLLQLMHN